MIIGDIVYLIKNAVLYQGTIIDLLNASMTIDVITADKTIMQLPADVVFKLPEDRERMLDYVVSQMGLYRKLQYAIEKNILK